MEVEQAMEKVRMDLDVYIGDFMADMCWKAQTRAVGLPANDGTIATVEQYNDLVDRLGSIVLISFLGPHRAAQQTRKWTDLIKTVDPDADYPVLTT